MASLLDDISNMGQVEPGGPQPTQPSEKPKSTGSTLSRLSGIEAPDAKITLEKGPGDDFDSIMKTIPELSQSDKDSAMLERFEQDKMRDSLLGINVGIAQFLDIPFEVSAMILRQIPGLKGVRGDPFGMLFEATGQVPEAGKEPDSAEFQIGKVVGNSIATLPLAPFGAGIQLGAQATRIGVGQALKGTAKAIGETAIRAPAKFAAGETVAALGAGLGIEAARTSFPDSDYAEFLGGMVGGVAPVFMPTRLAINAGRAIKRKILNFKAEGRIKAGEEIESAALNLESAGRKLDNPDLLADANATAAQKTGDPGIMALERSIIDRGHKSIYDADDQIARMNEVVENSLRAPESSIESTRATLESQKNYTQNLLDTNLKMAARNAEDAVTKLGPSATAEQANAIARREVESVEALARVDESTLWNNVPRESKVQGSTATEVIKAELIKRGRTADPADFPEELQLSKFFGKMVKGKKGKPPMFKEGILTKSATMGELQDFRSRVLRSMREERAKPASNNNKLRILDKLQEALLQDMGAVTVAEATSAGNSLRLALDYSRKINQTFNQGILGKLKGVDKTGTVAIPQELTLETAFGGKPAKAAENIRQIIKASKGVEGKIPPSPELLGAMEDFIKTDFQKRVIRGGQINSFKAQQYLERNAKILDEFPQIRDDIARAVKTEDVRAIRQRRTDMFTKNVLTSKATLFLEKSPRKMFEAIEVSRPEDFNREMNNILNKVKKDTTGEALEGLQIGFFDWLRQRATSGAVDAQGRKIISGQALDDLINNPKIAAMAGKVLNKGQIERLRKITNTAKAVEKARRAKGGDIDSDVLEAGESKLLTTIMRIAGAKTGAGISQVTGGGAGGLQAAAIMSERFKAITSGLNIKDPAAKLLTDAFADPSGELLKALLISVKTPKQLEKVSAKLHAWAASVAFQSGDKALAENTEE